MRTSPPTNCEGLARVIARMRGVSPENILPAAGSSDAIFLAFRQWLTPSSRVLILDPTYGEYAHVLEKVIGCRVIRLPLLRHDNYRVDLDELARLTGGTSYTSPKSTNHSGTRVTRPSKLNSGYDLIALVNPNSPTGQHIPRAELEELLRQIPATTRVWIDETYVEFAERGALLRQSGTALPACPGQAENSTGRQDACPTLIASESLERFATASANVVVCKSMSKVYALSGVRAAYLCGPRRIIAELRELTPPWAVSLPAQVAAVAALQDPDYYAARYAETHRLREQLADELSAFDGWKNLPGIANFLFCHLPADGPDAATLVKLCRAKNLFLRDVGSMGRSLGKHALRVAVKDVETNRRMVEILANAACEAAAGSCYPIAPGKGSGQTLAVGRS